MTRKRIKQGSKPLPPTPPRSLTAILPSQSEKIEVILFQYEDEKVAFTLSFEFVYNREQRELVLEEV